MLKRTALELRLGQLLINAMNLQQPCPELFHIDDIALAEKINQFSRTMKSELAKIVNKN